MTSEQMERIVEFHAGFDKRDPDPNKNYGIHGVDIKFILKTEFHAVQFLLGTDWFPAAIQPEQREKSFDFDTRFHRIQPQGYDLGYHTDSRFPINEYQKEHSDGDEYISAPMDCALMPSGKCYYDGSSLAADKVRDILLAEGSDGVWRELESYYRDTFGGTP